jgi:hypothetical protein
MRHKIIGLLALALLAPALAACDNGPRPTPTPTVSGTEFFLQGAWQRGTAGTPGFTLWQFDHGAFVQQQGTARQTGKYRITAETDNRVTLHLYEQSGDLGTADRDITFTIDRDNRTIDDGSGPLARPNS